MSTTWIRVTFGPVFALLAAFTVIFGILMVAPGPKPPADPGVTFRQLSQGGDTAGDQNRLTQQIDQFYGQASQFRSEFPSFQRNMFLAATGFGILLVLIGLALPAAVNYLRWGLLLGAVLLFGYAFWQATRSVPRVAPEGNSLLSLLGAGYPEQLNFASRFVRFAVAFIGLILALFLGLWRLTEWSVPQPRRAAVAPAAPAASAGQWAPPPPSAPITAAPAEPARTENREAVETPATEWRRPETP
jgi:hypothetical protein